MKVIRIFSDFILVKLEVYFLEKDLSNRGISLSSHLTVRFEQRSSSSGIREANMISSPIPCSAHRKTLASF